jgi:1-hydroxycarotenoid 3,4-desaturase
MWGSIKRRVKSPHLRMLLARYATYNGSDVRSAPATLGCISHVELAMGGFGVRGGMYELVRTLVRAAKRAGVQLQCGSPVKRIRVEAGAVTGVQLAGAFIPARTVVANANVAATATLLGSVVDHQIRSQQTPSMSGFNSIVRARHSQTRAPHTVLFPKDYLEEFADIFDRDQPPQDPTVYVCAQQRCHARAGWSDSEPLFLMANAPAEPAGRARTDGVWQALELRVMQRLRDANLLSAGYRTLWRRSPTELAARFPGSRGALYGSASNNSAAAFQRPANRVSAVRGLYLASGSAHPGGGIPLAALSGLAAARALSVDESNTCAK